MTNDILKQIKAGEVSGVQFKERALDEDINVTFTNNASAQEFVITVWRENKEFGNSYQPILRGCSKGLYTSTKGCIDPLSQYTPLSG